jgi:type IV pilus assembly protein PilZ
MYPAMPGNRLSQTQTVIERRRTPRTPVTVRIEYETVDAMFSEFTRNINECGVFIETEQPLAVDEQVRLHFRLPGSTDSIEVPGRVAWVSSGEGSGMPGMGIEFACLDEAARARIDELVKRLRVERNL